MFDQKEHIAMQKSIQIFISVDDVDLKDIETIEDKLQIVFEDYEYTRIQMTIQDEALVRPPRR